MRFSTILLVSLFTIFAHAQQSGPSVNFPMGHFGYDFLERMENSGFLPPSIELRNRPYSRRDVTRFIQLLDDRIRNGDVALGHVDRGLLSRLKGEFHRELSPNGDVQAEKHLFSWQTDDAGSYVVGDAIAEQAFQLESYTAKSDSNAENVSFSRASGRVRGMVHSRLAFYSDFTSTLIRGSERNYRFGENSQGGVINYNPASSNVYSLNSSAYLVIEPAPFRLQYGKDAVGLGPGRHDNLFLSGNGTAFDNLRLDVTFDRVKFTYLHGWLRSDALRYSPAPDTSVRKYVVVHRVEFKVLPWLFIAGHESVIYGGRGVEFAYLNPIIPYHITEQYLGDRDNNTIGFDVTAFPMRNLKLFAAIFIDDFTNTQNPFTYWKQTWAAQAGLFWTTPLGWSDADLRFEYARVEPYVYTHKYDLINYTHFGSGLGSSLQPNSDEFFVEWRFRPLSVLHTGVSYTLARHGRGNLDTFGYEDGFVDEGSGVPGKTKKHFLMGTNEVRNRIDGRIQWEPIPNHYAYLTGSLANIRNVGNLKDRNIRQTQFMVGYRLDY